MGILGDVELENTKSSEPRPLRNRYAPLKWTLLVLIVLEVLFLAINAFEFYSLHQLGVDPYIAEDDLSLTFSWASLVIGSAYTIAYLLSVVLVAMWTYRAMRNLQIVGSSEVEMSPGWAVGWYFIPFANLYKPFSGMAQIWRGSHAIAGRSTTIPASMGWWWFLWIVLNILGHISFRLGGGWSLDGEYYLTSLILDIVGAPMWVLCAFLLLRITGDVTRYQQQLSSQSVQDVFS